MTAIFGPFLTPSPLWTQNDVIVTLYHDIIVTNTDRILPTPAPARVRSSLKYPPLNEWSVLILHCHHTLFLSSYLDAKGLTLRILGNPWKIRKAIVPLSQKAPQNGLRRSPINLCLKMTQNIHSGKKKPYIFGDHARSNSQVWSLCYVITFNDTW